MQIKNIFAQQFAKIGQQANKAEFEVRFNQVQRGLIGQMNEKIDDIQNDGTERKIARLQKERDKLFDRTDTLRSLQQDMKTNALRFLEIRDKATAAIGAADADEDGSLSADELTALNEAIEDIQKDVSNLKFTHNYTEFSDGNLANRMRQELQSLVALTPETGTIDAEGSGSPSNDNRSVLDSLETIASQANNYADSTTILVGGINQLITNSSKAAYASEADLADLTLVEINKKQEEVDNVKAQYGNLIRAISLAFEVQSGLGDALVTGNQYEPEKGSILNIFT